MHIPYDGDEVSSEDDSIYFDTASHLSLDEDTENIVDLTENMLNPTNESPAIPLQQKNSHALMRPRAYQLEMLKEGLQHNIIVAMDTGSGKTLMYDP
ncbi:MAG: hypothetical protein M1812_004241 [Candelaria pacifica]|nr:MAG: hypothetical protein M1812_004241 [Candelaria pacifica]